MGEVLYLDGRRVNWDKPPRATTIVKWSQKSMYGQTVKGSLRTICHIDRMDRLAKKRFDSPYVIIQPPYNTTVAASAGTHDLDTMRDWWIPGVPWWTMQRFGRANGEFDWYRHWPDFSLNHIHGGTMPPREGRSIGDDFAVHGFKVGVYVPGQLEDYYNEAFGLSSQHTPGSDNSWFPDDKEATIFDLSRYIHNRRKERN